MGCFKVILPDVQGELYWNLKVSYFGTNEKLLKSSNKLCSTNRAPKQC